MFTSRQFCFIGSIILLLSCQKSCSALFFDDEISEPGWTFLEKFAFSEEANSTVAIHVDFLGSISNANLTHSPTLLLYDDDQNLQGGWPTVYKSDKSCLEKSKEAKYRLPLEKVGPTMELIRTTPSGRAVYWYIVFAFCDNVAFKADIQLEFLNNVDEDWRAHLSFDEDSNTEVSGLFFFLYAVFIIACGSFLGKLFSRGVLNAIHCLLFATMVVQCLAVGLQFIHFVDMTRDGIGSMQHFEAGSILLAVSQVGFLSCIQLLARGWTVTTNKLSRKRFTICYSLGLTGCYVGVVAAEQFRDKSATNYMFDTVQGLLVILLLFYLLIHFWILTYRAWVYEKRKPKKVFYRNLFGWITLWFMHLPIAVLIANGSPAWVRAKTVFGFTTAFQFFGFMIIPFLVRPSNMIEVYSREGNVRIRVPAANKAQRVGILPAGQAAEQLSSVPMPSNSMDTFIPTLKMKKRQQVPITESLAASPITGSEASASGIQQHISRNTFSPTAKDSLASLGTGNANSRAIHAFSDKSGVQESEPLPSRAVAWNADQSGSTNAVPPAQQPDDEDSQKKKKKKKKKKSEDGNDQIRPLSPVQGRTLHESLAPLKSFSGAKLPSLK